MEGSNMIEELEVQKDVIPMQPEELGLPPQKRMTRSKKRILLVGGALGLVSALLIATVPEWGFVSALASVFTGGASAVVTLIAKR